MGKKLGMIICLRNLHLNTDFFQGTEREQCITSNIQYTSEQFGCISKQNYAILIHTELLYMIVLLPVCQANVSRRPAERTVISEG